MPRNQSAMFGPPLPSSIQDAFRIGLNSKESVFSARQGETKDLVVREFFGEKQNFNAGDDLLDYVSRGGLPQNVLAIIAGQSIAHGIDLGTVAEVSESIPRCWRLVDREPQYVRINRQPMRVRGLPPGEQAIVARRLGRIASVAAAKARRHADNVAAHIERLLDFLAISGVRIPDAWHGYVPSDIVERWPSVQEAKGLLVGLHRNRPIAWQIEWIRKLEAVIDPDALERLRNGLTAFPSRRHAHFDIDDLIAFAQIGGGWGNDW